MFRFSGRKLFCHIFLRVVLNYTLNLKWNLEKRTGCKTNSEITLEIFVFYIMKLRQTNGNSILYEPSLIISHETHRIYKSI